MPTLFSPLKIRTIELKNRIIMSPMCQYSATDGMANDWHLAHYGSRAVGGAAMTVVEATAVSPEGRISPSDLGLWKDQQIEPLKKIAGFISAQNCIPAIQLAHAGRKASKAEPWNGDILLTKATGGWKTLAPSPIPFADDYDTPVQLSHEGIRNIISAFTDAAKRAYEAGFKIIEIHAAHGYLINQFLSPLSNKRTDDYGGSFDNRIRLLLEIISAVRTVWHDALPLFVRLSTTEWHDHGWSVDDSLALAEILKNNGIDLIDCSSGGNITGVKIPLVPGYQVPLAEKIKKQTGILTAAVGLITQPIQANQIITDAQADLVMLARELLRNPYFPLMAAKELNADTPYPKQYLRAKPKK